jgi:hypothetical protein
LVATAGLDGRTPLQTFGFREGVAVIDPKATVANGRFPEI